MQWPAAHVRLIAEYLRTEPAPIEHIRWALASLEARTVNMNLVKGATPHSIEKFMLFQKAWDREDLTKSDRYSDADKSFLKALMGPK